MVAGEYKLLIEPLGYYTFQGVFIATTATEAALYDEQLGGGLRSKMVSFSHQNLPLAIFSKHRISVIPHGVAAEILRHRTAILNPPGD